MWPGGQAPALAAALLPAALAVLLSALCARPFVWSRSPGLRATCRPPARRPSPTRHAECAPAALLAWGLSLPSVSTALHRGGAVAQRAWQARHRENAPGTSFESLLRDRSCAGCGGQETISPARLPWSSPLWEGTGHNSVRPAGGLAEAAPGVRCEVREGVSGGRRGGSWKPSSGQDERLGVGRGPEAEAPRSRSPSAKPGHVGIRVLFGRHRSVVFKVVGLEPTARALILAVTG